MEDLYSAGGSRVYDAVTRSDRSEVREFINLSRQHPGRILDLGAGSGRLTIPLARLGHEMHALDNSRTMLQLLQERTSSSCPVTTHLGNMATFSLGLKFDLIILGATSITLLNAEDRRNLMSSVRTHLAPGGSFALSLADADAAHELSQAKESHLQFSEGQIKQSVYFTQELSADGRSRLVNFADLSSRTTPPGSVPVYFSTVQLLPMDEMIRELENGGFSVENVHQVRSSVTGLGRGIVVVECR
ncbi:daptide-type RiPP biosynthesis methyltransferase [Arthrobacter sp. RAF14]|uniref:daptide-type RiPP biosynthesis methyltransferase n=1 Tax=Arthrobacter sp. RAF14 TaxID=3233051 RepID=UPI003F902C18